MSNIMTKPAFDTSILPDFSQIGFKQIEKQLEDMLAANRKSMQTVLARQDGQISWKNSIEPMEELENRLSRFWSPIKHLNAVADSEDLRTVYNACLPRLSAYYTEIGQNRDYYRVCKIIADSPEFASLDHARQKVIENALRDFRLSGIELDKDDQARFKELRQQLSETSNRFDQNLLDATHNWKELVTNQEQLKGLPESALALARQTAQREGHSEDNHWLFTLEFPSYMPVMSYADNRELRQQMYQAYVTRASDQSPDEWDNSPLMQDLLTLRLEMAQLLGFENYAEYSLATKMAKNPDQVLSFLTELGQDSRPVATKELKELQEFAREHYNIDKLEAWDLPYYSEKLRQHRYGISQESLRPYFPVPRVLEGLFKIVNLLYGLEITEVKGVDVWHPDVSFFQISDQQKQLRGGFYLDLYARPRKRGGAWMDECIIRKRGPQGLQDPVAYLTCNFTPPITDNPSLLTHNEVTTLFHEFGHGLHHMLTQVEVAGVSGINGVEWDAVELPSQFMENWCWEREAMDLFSGHYETGHSIDDALFEKLLAAKNFQSGMQMVRQLELALFDFRLHMRNQATDSKQIQEQLDAVRAEVAVVTTPAFNRFQHGFSHIFAGGYAAGYYSYKWAEVLSADAFSLFEEKGIFDRSTGELFLHSILEQGGSSNAMDLFINFRGREPSIAPLLRHSGISQ